MNLRASRVRWAAGLGVLAVTASVVVVAVRHHHVDSSALDSPSVGSLLDKSGRALEARSMALSAAHRVKLSAQVDGATPVAAKACDLGHDRDCNEEASSKLLRGTCRHDGTCECVAGSEKTVDGRCR
jgi:hypothetical protein